MKKEFKIKDYKIKAFFRAFCVTLICIGCVAGTYLGCCEAYDAIRKTCFDDDRGAVVIGEEYIKFFDLEIYG